MMSLRPLPVAHATTVTRVRPSRTLVALASVAVLAALSGCSSSASPFTGDWGATGEDQPRLTIEGDGTFTGNDGCNDLSGKGTVSGDTFTFGNFASTLKACEGVTPWLNRAHTAKVSGDRLVVYEDGGDKIGTLAKR